MQPDTSPPKIDSSLADESVLSMPESSADDEPPPELEPECAVSEKESIEGQEKVHISHMLLL